MNKLIEFCQNVSGWVQTGFDSMDAIFRAIRQTYVFIDDLIDVLPAVMYGVLFASFVIITGKLVVGRD